MEFKHFSHNHGLVFHQVAQGAEVHCSGCKTPGSGNVYACWKCSYFLHEQCFRATRSLSHPSHPNHPLTLVPYPTHLSGSFFCNFCNHFGNGLSYWCSECDFDIHIHCAHMDARAVPNASRPTSIPVSNNNPHDATHNVSHQAPNPIYPPPPIPSNPFPSYPPPGANLVSPNIYPPPSTY